MQKTCGIKRNLEKNNWKIKLEIDSKWSWIELINIHQYKNRDKQKRKVERKCHEPKMMTNEQKDTARIG